MKNNPNKTVCATDKGIVISYHESNKHQFLAYQERSQVKDYTETYQSRPVFNTVQQQIYAQTLYGLRHFNKHELKTMPEIKKHNILKHHQRVQQFLNRWKQEIISKTINEFLTTFFPKSNLVKTMVSIPDYDQSVLCNTSFKELGLDQVKIAKKLVEVKLLPNNFFSLKA